MTSPERPHEGHDYDAHEGHDHAPTESPAAMEPGSWRPAGFSVCTQGGPIHSLPTITELMYHITGKPNPIPKIL